MMWLSPYWESQAIKCELVLMCREIPVHREEVYLRIQREKSKTEQRVYGDWSDEIPDKSYNR